MSVEKESQASTRDAAAKALADNDYDPEESPVQHENCMLDFKSGWQACLDANKKDEDVAVKMELFGRIINAMAKEVITSPQQENYYLFTPEQINWAEKKLLEIFNLGIEDLKAKMKERAGE